MNKFQMEGGNVYVENTEENSGGLSTGDDKMCM